MLVPGYGYHPDPAGGALVPIVGNRGYEQRKGLVIPYLGGPDTIDIPGGVGGGDVGAGDQLSIEGGNFAATSLGFRQGVGQYGGPAVVIRSPFTLSPYLDSSVSSSINDVSNQLQNWPIGGIGTLGNVLVIIAALAGVAYLLGYELT